MTTINYGTLDLQVIGSTDSLVPKQAQHIELPDEDKKALALAVRDNLSALLLGETGTGKTSVVRELAFLLKQPYVRVNMTGFTSPDELIGSKSVKNGATYYENGIITDAMLRGAILVIDEINATSPDCLFILHGLLDEDRRITLPNGDIITPHKNFRVFATGNPDYEGTRGMNRAFLDRFPIVLLVEPPTPEVETKIIIDRTSCDHNIANGLVATALMARKDYIENKILTYVSTRSLINTANLIKNGIEPLEAYCRVVANKGNNLDEKRLLKDFFLSVFKINSEDKKEEIIVTTKSRIDQLEQEIKTKDISVINLENQRSDQDKTIESSKQALEQQAKHSEQQDKTINKLNKKINLMQKRLDAFKIIEKIIHESHP